MAAYFDFKTHIPHVNKDDIYVKSGNVVDDKLVLEYSLSNYTPLSISLSGFDTFTYINDAEFKDNKLILKYGRPTLPNLSIELSTLDKHVDSVAIADDKKSLSLCFNDNTYISVDTTSFAENYYLSTWSVSGKNLILKYNTDKLDPMVIDLEKITNKIIAMDTANNILTISDLMENVASVSLEKFTYNDFIREAKIDDANLLILKYASDYASGHAKDLLVDLSPFAKNYYINKSELTDEQLVLSYNNAAAGDSLSTSLSTLNNYIKSATIEDKTLILTYNSDRLQPIRINIADFIKDYYVKDVKLSDDNKLYFTYNSDDPILGIDPIDLSRFAIDTNIYIKKIAHDEHNDIITFQYNTAELSTHVVNLRKYVNNDIDAMHLHNNALILNFKDGSTKHVSLDELDKYIKSYDADLNNLSLYYNNDKGCIVLDKAKISKAIVNARIDGNMFYLDYSDGTPSLTVDMTDSLTHIVNGEIIGTNLKLGYSNSTPELYIDVSKLSTYIEKAELKLSEKDKTADLIFDYNADNLNHSPISVSLNALNNQITRTYTSGSNLILEFANGNTRVIDLSEFHRYINSVYLNGNALVLKDNNGYELTTSLDKFDKYIKEVYVDKTAKNIQFKYNTDDPILRIDIPDINYELTSGEVNSNNHIILKFSNNKSDIDIDASSLKSDDTFISTIVHDETNDIILFDYNNSKVQAKSICLKKYVNNDLVRVALDKDTNNLILYFERLDKYLDVSLDKFDKYVSSLSVDDKSNRLMLFYNNDKGHISIDKDKLDTYTTEVKVDDNNALILKDNQNKELSTSLAKFDKYIDSANIDKEYIIFNFNNAKEAFKISLKDINYELTSGEVNDLNIILKFSNDKANVVIDASKLKTVDNYISSGYFDNTTSKLVLKYKETEQSIPPISIDIPKANNYYISSGYFDVNAESIDKKLVLKYNTTELNPINIDFNILSNMNFCATDEKDVLSIAQTVEQIVTAFGGNRAKRENRT